MSDQDNPHRPIGYIDRDGEMVWDECETCTGQGWPCETAQEEDNND